MQATLRGDEKSLSTAEVEIQTFTSQEKFRMAAIGLGICWALAVFTVLVPILHFVLVPGFFIGGIAYAIYCLRLDKRIRALDGPCPICQKPIHIENMNITNPITSRCEACYCTFEILLPKT